MNEMRPITCQGVATYFRDTLEEEENKPQIALASKNFAPLICRVVRAVRWRWALGLDSRWGSPLRSVLTPNLRLAICPLTQKARRTCTVQETGPDLSPLTAPQFRLQPGMGSWLADSEQR